MTSDSPPLPDLSGYKVFRADIMKYIVVEINGEPFLISGHYDSYHEDILTAFARRYRISTVKVLGGGYISFKKAPKTILLTGYSGSFDKAHTETVRQLVTATLMREDMADYEIVIEDTENDLQHVKQYTRKY